MHNSRTRGALRNGPGLQPDAPPIVKSGSERTPGLPITWVLPLKSTCILCLIIIKHQTLHPARDKQTHTCGVWSRICHLKDYNRRAPGWLSQLSLWLWLRLWSHGSWVWALRRALCWQPGACFGFCVSPSLCPSPAHALSLSVSKTNKNINK